jgi:hypothetical protein
MVGLGQGVYETVQGLTVMTVGAVEIGITWPAAGTGAGAAVPALGVVAVIAGAAEGGLGIWTVGNVLNMGAPDWPTGGNGGTSGGGRTPHSDSRVLQTGGHTINERTREGLGLTREQCKNAIEGLKADNNLPNNWHSGRIYDNGDVFDANTRQYIGNLFDYVD